MNITWVRACFGNYFFRFFFWIYFLVVFVPLLVLLGGIFWLGD